MSPVVAVLPGMVSIVASVQAAFMPFSAPSPPGRSRGLSRESTNLPDLGV